MCECEERVRLKLGNVFLQHVNMFFSLTLIVNCFFFSFTRLQKQNFKKRQKKPHPPVTRLLSFIFVLFTFLLETIMFVMVTSDGKLHTVF